MILSPVRRGAQARHRVRSRDAVAHFAPVATRPAHESATSVTELLRRATGGDPDALGDVFPLVYHELRRLAHRQLRDEREGYTLTPTALVHEAYLRLSAQTRVDYKCRAHFLSIASTAMRRILIDRARRHRSLKRGGLVVKLPLDGLEIAAEQGAELLLALDDALERLRALDARQAQVVECRFFGGMSEQDTAEALGVAPRTVTRDWAKARSWLHRELRQETMPAARRAPAFAGASA